jgi:hypothetical protein
MMVLAALLVFVGPYLAARLGMPPQILIPALLALVWVPAAISTQIDRRRQRARVLTWSKAHAWQFQESDRSLIRRWVGEPFGAGRWRAAVDVLRGVHRGRDALSFTYRWTTGFARSRTIHTCDVVVLELPAALPMLQLTPEDPIARLFGGQDLRIELEEFNARWQVESDDPRFAHGVLHPLLIERLMAQPRIRGLGMRIDGSSILAWALGPVGPYGRIRLADLLELVVESIPRHVWDDFGGDPHAAVER